MHRCCVPASGLCRLQPLEGIRREAAGTQLHAELAENADTQSGLGCLSARNACQLVRPSPDQLHDFAPLRG